MTEEKKARPPVFIEGYLNDLAMSGRRPTYGYPNDGGLPDTKGRVMKVETSYIKGRKS